MRRLLVVLALAVALVGGWTWYAAAQTIQVKHFACYNPTGPQPWKAWYYLPNGADPCPSGHVKIDWIDD